MSTAGFDRCVDMGFWTIHEEVWGTAGDGQTPLLINSHPGQQMWLSDFEFACVTIVAVLSLNTRFVR